MQKIQAIKINRNNIDQTNIIDFDLPNADSMAEGSVLLHIDIFSLSSNNITYAVTGNSLKYWKFFPVDAESSMLPVWGFASVIASSHSDVKVGERFYGYYPMSSHVLVKPSKVNAFGFIDANPTRVSNNPLYDHHANIKMDLSYRAEDEAMLSLFKPLFITSFLLQDFLIENDFFDSEQVLITSGSSKTSYGLAAILHEAKKSQGQNVNIVALTSDSNVKFVDELNMYDEIITYSDLDKLNTGLRTCIIDFTGNQKLLKKIASNLGDAHTYTSLIGAVQNDQLEDEPGAEKHGQFFFAPIQAQKCVARLGNEEFAKQYSGALNDFIQNAKTWLNIEEITGDKNIEKAYLELLKHSPSPREGLIAHF